MFSTIVVVIVVLYVLGYIGMITFDLFIKKDPTDLIPKPQDVEIDITDEAGQFKPILVEKDDKTDSQTSLDEKALTEDTDQQTQDAATVSTTSTAPEQIPEQEKVDEPKRTDEETKRRISELVKLRRQEILAEEMGDERAPAPDSSERKTEIQDNNESPVVEVSPSTPKSIVPTVDESTKPIGYYKPKTPIQPEHAPLKFFEFKVRIEATTQLTKPQGGLTAEQLSKEAKELTTDEKMKLLKEMDNYWELKENSRTLDEDERIAIEKAREARHEAHPTFSA